MSSCIKLTFITCDGATVSYEPRRMLLMKLAMATNSALTLAPADDARAACLLACLPVMSVMFSSMKTGHFRATLTQSKALTHSASQSLSKVGWFVGSLAGWLVDCQTRRFVLRFL